jgi:hypothetical protein
MGFTMAKPKSILKHGQVIRSDRGVSYLHFAGEIRAVQVNVQQTVQHVNKTLEYIFGIPMAQQTLTLLKNRQKIALDQNKSLTDYKVEPFDVIELSTGNTVTRLLLLTQAQA